MPAVPVADQPEEGQCSPDFFCCALDELQTEERQGHGVNAAPSGTKTVVHNGKVKAAQERR